jgi:hypothetical protein
MDETDNLATQEVDPSRPDSMISALTDKSVHINSQIQHEVGQEERPVTSNFPFSTVSQFQKTAPTFLDSKQKKLTKSESEVEFDSLKTAIFLEAVRKKHAK